MTTSRTLLLGAALLIACKGKEPANKTPTVETIVATVRDTEMKRVWRQAAERKQLPDMATLPPFQPGVAVRHPVTVPAQPAQQPKAKVINQSVVAAVVPFSTQPVVDYTGAMQVTDIQAGRITGTLTGRAAPLEIHFKLPGGAVLATIAPRARLQLRLRDDVEGVTQRRVLILADTTRLTTLLSISDGGDTPYARNFDEGSIGLRQNAPARAGQPSTVTFTSAGSSATVRPGERGQLTARGRRIGVFVLSSYWGDPKNEAREGDAYHVMAIAWAMQ